MANVIFMCIFSLFSLCFSAQTDSNEFVFPLHIPTLTQNVPNLLFINEGETVGRASISIPQLSIIEDISVVSQEIFLLYYALREILKENDIILTIFIRTSGTIRPYASLRQSHPSISIQPISSAGKEYHLYDSKGYDLNFYCLDILSLHNNTKVEIIQTIHAGKSSSVETTDITLDEFQTNRICLISENTRVVSSTPFVLTISGDYEMTENPSLIDMLVAYSYWGKTFTVYPLQHQQKFRTFCRIFCVKNDCTVYYQDQTELIISADTYMDVEVMDPFILVSNTPVFVTLSAFEKLPFYNTTHEEVKIDPTLNMPVMPSEQYISKIYINPSSESNESAIICTKCSWLSHITFDDEALASKLDVEITTIKNDSNDCVITVPIKPETTHKVRSHLQSASFTAVINISNVNTDYVYVVHGFDKTLNCKTVIFGHDIYEHECDVIVFEKNTSCSGPPLDCYQEEETCSFCLRLYGLIGLGIGSAASTIIINVICQVWYWPKRTRKKEMKMITKKVKEREEEMERDERHRIRNAEIFQERRRIAERIIQKPTDNTMFYKLIADLGGEPNEPNGSAVKTGLPS
ncbi:uncharacterized protein [Antedon mediterranea]|uniref:uncharacterized protein n=1 Tax=Antedon mediterranea TaxID=105859 RepID=UPI003AF8245C